MTADFATKFCKRGCAGWLVVAAIAIAVAMAPGPASAQEELPLSGSAYENADEAYKAFSRGDFASAITKTRQAISLRPDVMRLRSLLADALVAAGDLDEADAVISQAIVRFGDDADLLKQRKDIGERRTYKIAAEAFAAADSAHKAFAQDDYKKAVAEARKAVSIAPSNPAYRLLLINTLMAAGELTAAEKEVSDAIAQFGINPELRATERSIRERLGENLTAQAFVAASAAYKAYESEDYERAVAEARNAVSLDPDSRSYRLLLVNSLLAARENKAAELAVAEALSRFPTDIELLARQSTIRRPVIADSKTAQPTRAYAMAEAAYRAFARHDYKAAIREAQKALSLEPGNRSYRLLLADAALAAQQPDRALDALAPLGNAQSYDVAARRGFALQALKRNEEAVRAFEIAARNSQTSTERATALAGQLGLLVELGRKEEAKARFVEALTQGELNAMPAANVASIAVRVGNDPVAHEYFERAFAAGRLKGAALLDAAYTATGLSRNEQAVALFKAGIDANAEGALSLEPRQLFGVRRSVAELSRTWGAYASLTYSRAGAGPGVPFAPPSTGGRTLQASAEVYWRPPVVYRNGSGFEVFGRLFQTLHDEAGGPVGPQTTQAGLGIRWKPFSEFYFVLEVARLFAIGNLADNDWLLRAAYSQSEGTDLRVDVPDWFTWQFNADVNHFIETSQFLTGAELRIGQSLRLDVISSRIVLFPHFVFVAQYNNLLAIPGTVGAGIGLTSRFWFREDIYTAPMSHLDLTLQYRFGLAGDKRVEGMFGQALVSY